MTIPVLTPAEIAACRAEEEATRRPRPIAPREVPPTPDPLGPPLSFAELLRRHRLARGLSQAALARRVGLDHGSVSRWEAGNRDPYPESVGRLCAALSLDGAAKDDFYLAAGVMPPDLPRRDLLILLGIARAGEAGLVTLALQLARAARNASRVG